MNDDGVFGRAYMWEPVMPIGPVNFSNPRVGPIFGVAATVTIALNCRCAGPCLPHRGRKTGFLETGLTLTTAAACWGALRAFANAIGKECSSGCHGDLTSGFSASIGRATPCPGMRQAGAGADCDGGEDEVDE